MLTIKNLSVNIEDKIIVDNLSMNFEIGENYCVIGKNGSGKSSLAMTIMGHQHIHYKIKSPRKS